MGSLKEPSAPLPDDDADREMRSACLAFGSIATRLVVPGVCGSEGAARESEAMSAVLAGVLTDFGESNAAKVLRMNRLQRKMERSKKVPKQPRSIVPSLHLAGLVRQVGSGNLSGFAGYALGAHTLNVAYANDRGDPSEGDESPLLRLQPKVHFDVDI